MSRVNGELSKACQLGFRPGTPIFGDEGEKKVGKDQNNLPASTVFSNSFSFNIH